MRFWNCRKWLSVFVASAAAIIWSPSGFGDDIDACLKEAWPEVQTTCLTGIAIEAADPALCLRSGEPAVRWRCVAGYAEDVGDASACAVLPVDDLDTPGAAEDLCRAHLAISWREPDRCMSLGTPHLADSCLLQLAQLSREKTLCEHIENEILLNACRDL